MENMLHGTGKIIIHAALGAHDVGQDVTAVMNAMQQEAQQAVEMPQAHAVLQPC